jgi:hypothetical protein
MSGELESRKMQLEILTNSILNKPVDSDAIRTTIQKLAAENDEIQADIRKERRIFLDSDVSTSPSIGGLYYTSVTDNKILIAFFSCFGGFLLIFGISIIAGFINIEYFLNMSSTNRIISVVLIWFLCILLTYLALNIFT